MARQRIINPCIDKGRYGGSRYSGYHYVLHNQKIESKACGCAHGFISHGRKKQSLLFYAQAKTKTKCPLIEIKAEEGPPKDYFKVVKCDGVFRHANSIGTKSQQKLVSKKFKGCQKIEEDLINDGLVAPVDTKQVLVDQIFVESIEKERPLNPNDLVDFSYRDDIELNFVFEQKKKITFHRDFLKSSSINEILRPAPKDLKHSYLRTLVNLGQFDHDLELRLSSFLMDRELTSKLLVESIFPGFTFATFQSCQSKIHALLQKEMPPHYKDFDKVWSTLTKAQQDACKKMYMENEEKLTKTAVAEKLSINRKTLDGRLQGAFKKFKFAFPDLIEKPKPKKVEAKASEKEAEPKIKPKSKKLSQNELKKIQAWLDSTCIEPKFD